MKEPTKMTDKPENTNWPAGQLFIIQKGSYYYRPNAQGYTTNISKAGRYTLDQAIRYSHPNGPDGPRDGIGYFPAPIDHAAALAEALEAIRQTASIGMQIGIEQGAVVWRDTLQGIEKSSSEALARSSDKPDAE